MPFCLKKCSYCDFYSINALSLLPSYVASLQREIKMRSGLAEFSSLSGQAGSSGMSGYSGISGSSGACGFFNPSPSRVTSTIYFGGGTPSLLPLEDIGSILEIIDACYQVSDNPEITFEMNPGTIDGTYLAELKNLGINRLSIGVQSFDPRKLAVLDRIHTIDQSIQAIEAAQSVGFENIGLDLIYGLPWETRETWIQDLETAMKFKPSHLSCYMLTLEPGTQLYKQYEKGIFTPQTPEILVDFFMETSVFLGKKGYEHYEISNFALGRGNRSCHNSNYWNYTPYDGFGPSAHSFGFIIGKNQESSRRYPARYWNLADVRDYVAKLSSGRLSIQEKEELSIPQQMLEMVMMGLRTSDGLDIKAFEMISGQSFFQEFRTILARLETQDLGKILTESVRGKRLQLTLAGRARLDNIVEAFADIIL